MKCEARNIAYWGEWKEGTFNGKGRYFWENGWYEGQFKNGFLEGQGIRFVRGEKQHCIFSGEFANNTLEGMGKETCIDNEYFNNESAIITQHVVKGKRGKHQVYDGEYSKGLYSGLGVYRWLGATYKAQWKLGFPHKEVMRTKNQETKRLFYDEEGNYHSHFESDSRTFDGDPIMLSKQGDWKNKMKKTHDIPSQEKYFRFESDIDKVQLGPLYTFQAEDWEVAEQFLQPEETGASQTEIEHATAAVELENKRAAEFLKEQRKRQAREAEVIRKATLAPPEEDEEKDKDGDGDAGAVESKDGETKEAAEPKKEEEPAKPGIQTPGYQVDPKAEIV